MKISRSLSVLAITFCAFQSSSMAQTAPAPSGWYAGGSVGSSGIKLRSENVVTNGQQDTRDTGYKLIGGYQFNKTWAAEFQYFDLGSYRYSEAAPATGTATVDTQGFSISGIGSWPVTEKISVLGKLGLAQQRFTARAVSSAGRVTPLNATKMTTLIGVGAEYQINKTLRVRTEYEYFGVPTVFTSGTQKLKLRTDLLSVGLLYQF
ncbi:MAG: outer membrane beta-barrel protein [Burkholderiaceae bacterium]|nr:outer membrane beta-barrel protein [Burkholderiaceae bacterium]